MTNDGQNQYAYDAEGRVCAVENLIGGLYGYLYNAEGVRVAKGTIQLVNGNLSCDTTQNGFQVTASYILDQNNQQLTEMSWSGGTAQWAHTNVWAAGAPIATYSVNPNPSDNQPGILNFLLTDWLGTRRVLTDSAGNPDEVCHSLPYGDGEDCAPTPTEHLFTGKERDAETLNDYFGARYFASTMGRFLSPDWSAAPMGVPYADMSDPQSLNLYGYVRDNPLSQTDLNGHDPNGYTCSLTAAEMTCGPSPTTPDASLQSPQEVGNGNPMSQEQSGARQTHGASLATGLAAGVSAGGILGTISNVKKWFDRAMTIKSDVDDATVLAAAQKTLAAAQLAEKRDTNPYFIGPQGDVGVDQAAEGVATAQINYLIVKIGISATDTPISSKVAEGLLPGLQKQIEAAQQRYNQAWTAYVNGLTQP